MIQTKKILSVFLLASLLILPITVFAQISEPPIITTSTNPNVWSIMIRIITFVWEFFAGLAVIMFIYAGILFVASSGAPDRITRARMSFLWGVVGIIVAVIAFSIVAIVKNNI